MKFIYSDRITIEYIKLDILCAVIRENDFPAVQVLINWSPNFDWCNFFFFFIHLTMRFNPFQCACIPVIFFFFLLLNSTNIDWQDERQIQRFRGKKMCTYRIASVWQFYFSKNDGSKYGGCRVMRITFGRVNFDGELWSFRGSRTMDPNLATTSFKFPLSFEDRAGIRWGHNVGKNPISYSISPSAFCSREIREDRGVW